MTLRSLSFSSPPLRSASLHSLAMRPGGILFPSASCLPFWNSMRPENQSNVKRDLVWKAQKRAPPSLRRAGRLRRKIPKSAPLRPRLHAQEGRPRDRCRAVQSWLDRAVGDQLHDCRASQTGRPGRLRARRLATTGEGYSGHRHGERATRSPQNPAIFAVLASIPPPETVGSALRTDAWPTEKILFRLSQLSLRRYTMIVPSFKRTNSRSNEDC